MNIKELYIRFPTQKSCLSHLEEVLWNNRPICPYCGSVNSSPMPSEIRHHCNDCNVSYRVTVGTIFHKTKLDLQKWFLAIVLVLNAQNNTSVRQLARDLEVNKNTACYMAKKIKRAMKQANDQRLLTRLVEIVAK